jgi:hypothetical protein
VGAQNSRQTPKGKPFSKGNDPRRNAGGRPLGFGARIRELTKDGEELIEIALRIARGEYTIKRIDSEGGTHDQEPSAREVMDAVKWLALYGIGTPPKLEADDDLKRMSLEELKALAKSLESGEGNAPTTAVSQ